jgi:membrane protein
MDVAFRIWKTQSSENIGLLAAGVAFYGLLSLFPGITAAMALAGLFTDRTFLLHTPSEIGSILPSEAREIVMGQLHEVASADESALGIAFVFTLGLALYSASRATSNLIIGLNVIYEEDEKRGFVALALRTLLLTLALIFVLLIALALIAVLPAVAEIVPNAPVLTEAVLMLRWVVLFLLGVGSIAVLYQFGPSRRNAKWRWLTPGAFIACFFWIVGSIGFSVYVQSFGSYNETFGALGGVIVLLTWLWLSAFIVLLGALIDAELEAQTRIDSTIGPERPMGQRGATKADELGVARSR